MEGPRILEERSYYNNCLSSPPCMKRFCHPKWGDHSSAFYICILGQPMIHISISHHTHEKLVIVDPDVPAGSLQMSANSL